MKKKELIEGRCSSCKYWNNKQAELEYSTFYGICTCHRWKFTTTNDSDCLLLDRQNRSEKHMGVNRFESQSVVVPIGAVDKSWYCFVTEEKFGCIHYNAYEKTSITIKGKVTCPDCDETVILTQEINTDQYGNLKYYHCKNCGETFVSRNGGELDIPAHH